MVFICNTSNCRKKLSDYQLLTHCSHIFCATCGSKIKQTLLCPACDESLEPVTECIIEKNLKMIKEKIRKEMVGFDLQDILECIKESIQFCTFQNDVVLYNKDVQINRLEREYENITQNIETIQLKHMLDKKRMKQNIKKIISELKREKDTCYDLSCQLREKNELYEK